jgi:glutathione S-transferase
MAELFPKFMGFISERVKGGGFLVGDAPTIADCTLIPALDRFTCGSVDHVPADCMDAFPEVAAYVKRFMALPEVAAYYDALGGPVAPGGFEMKA